MVYCFQCGKVPEDESGESSKVNVNKGYYCYCGECYAKVSNKKNVLRIPSFK